MPHRIGFWPLARLTVLYMLLTRQISNLMSPFAMLFVKCCAEKQPAIGQWYDNYQLTVSYLHLASVWRIIRRQRGAQKDTHGR